MNHDRAHLEGQLATTTTPSERADILEQLATHHGEHGDPTGSHFHNMWAVMERARAKNRALLDPTPMMEAVRGAPDVVATIAAHAYDVAARQQPEDDGDAHYVDLT